MSFKDFSSSPSVKASPSSSSNLEIPDQCGSQLECKPMVLFKGDFTILVEVDCKPDQSCPHLHLHLLQVDHGICTQVRESHQSHQFRIWHCAAHVSVTVMLLGSLKKYVFTWKPPSSLLLWSGCLHLCRLSSNVAQVLFPSTWSMFNIVMQYDNIPIQFTSNTWRSKTETPFYRYLRRIALYCCQNMPHLNQSNYSGSVYK